MVSGTMAITAATLAGGSAAINAQRGTATWGANYTFNSDGIQSDVTVIADSLAQAGITASGTQSVGSSDTPIASSGLYMLAIDGTVMQLVLHADGLVSGVVA